MKSFIQNPKTFSIITTKYFMQHPEIFSIEKFNGDIFYPASGNILILKIQKLNIFLAAGNIFI